MTHELTTKEITQDRTNTRNNNIQKYIPSELTQYINNDLNTERNK